MKNKMIKKALALLSAGIISSTLITGIFASANTTMYSWDTFRGNEVYASGSSIPYRETMVQGRKDTSSSIYIENNGYRDIDDFYAAYVTVYGRYNYESTWTSHDVDTCSYYWGSINTHNIRIRNGDKRLIRQYVNENGYQIAKVFIKDCAVRSTRGRLAFDTMYRRFTLTVVFCIARKLTLSNIRPPITGGLLYIYSCLFYALEYINTSPQYFISCELLQRIPQRSYCISPH